MCDLIRVMQWACHGSRRVSGRWTVQVRGQVMPWSFQWPVHGWSLASVYAIVHAKLAYPARSGERSDPAGGPRGQSPPGDEERSDRRWERSDPPPWIGPQADPRLWAVRRVAGGPGYGTWSGPRPTKETPGPEGPGETC